MAKSNYSKPTKLTFYPSYLQYAYATGLIEGISYDTLVNPDLNDEDVYNMVVVDPSNTTRFSSTSESYFAWKIPDNWNFDFGMILGHNFNNYLTYQPYSFTGEDDPIRDTIIHGDNIVNYNAFGAPQFNGWSAFTLGNLPTDQNWIGIDETHEGSLVLTDTYIGSVLFGKKWEAPINVNINSSIHYNYGNKIKKTIGGKTLSQMNYYKPNRWGDLDAWELHEDLPTNRVDSRNGIRKWDVTMSFLKDEDVLPQNMMSNSNSWQRDNDSDYYVGADGTSLYNSSNGRDFYTSVIKMTMGSHLNTVVKISESNNPDQWAIVKITKYSIRSTNPKFVDVSLTLEEQV